MTTTGETMGLRAPPHGWFLPSCAISFCSIAMSSLLFYCADSLGAGLEAYLGKDLAKLDTNQLSSFAVDFKKVTGEELKTDWGSPHPWWVKKFQSGHVSFVLLNVYPGLEIPDVSFAEAHLFDANWRRLASQSVPTGYRMFLTAADVVSPSGISGDAISIQTASAGPFIVEGDKKKPAFEQGDSQTQIYGCVSNELRLVRIVDNHGQLVLNSYRWSRPMKGPAVPSWSTDTWLQTLSATNQVEVLSALVWLSGSHLAESSPRQADHNQETVKDSATYEAVQKSPQTKAILQKLVLSTNTWIRAYATTALRSLPK